MKGVVLYIGGGQIGIFSVLGGGDAWLCSGLYLSLRVQSASLMDPLFIILTFSCHVLLKDRGSKASVPAAYIAV